MKSWVIRFAIALFAVALGGCAARSIQPSAGAAPASPRLAGLAWLAGDWEGTSDEGGAMDEHWIAARGNSMLGVSREIGGGKLRFFELLRIEDRGDAVYLVPQPNGRAPHDFTLVRLEGQRAIFESAGGDRIRRITYGRDGDVLSVRLEGEEHGKAIDWSFRFHASPSSAWR